MGAGAQPQRAWAAAQRHWPWCVAGVVLAAVALRLALIALSDGGADLGIYLRFGRLALAGANPYDAPSGGPISPVMADSPPLEFALFAGLLKLHDAPSTLRGAFALCDGATIALVALLYPRPRAWRGAFVVFYAFNPFVLVAWTVFSEDKTLLFLLIVLLLLALERDRLGRAWSATSALVALKFLGVFFAPVLALHSWRERGRRGLVPVGAFVLVAAASCLPWFPDSLDAFDHRHARLVLDPPFHAGLGILLARLGLYAPFEPQLAMALALLAVFVAFALLRLDVRDAVVLSIFAGYAFLPDEVPNRILLITLPFLLVLSPSRRGWAAIWGCSLPAAAAVVVAAKGAPAPLEHLLGRESSVPHVLWSHLLPALVLVLWARERRTVARPLSHGVRLAA
jgi:hypothetical protein